MNTTIILSVLVGFLSTWVIFLLTRKPESRRRVSPKPNKRTLDLSTCMDHVGQRLGPGKYTFIVRVAKPGQLKTRIQRSVHHDR